MKYLQFREIFGHFFCYIRKDSEYYLNKEQMRPFKQYLINVGIRSCEYSYKDEDLFDNVDYFYRCWKIELSECKALEFLYDYLNNDFHPKVTNNKSA